MGSGWTLDRALLIPGLAGVITYYLLTESEVITGKSQTEALMY